MWLGNEFNTADRATARRIVLKTEDIILMKLTGNNLAGILKVLYVR